LEESVDFGLKNKTALVLGAGGGLGCAIARALANEGANLAIADISQDSLGATAKSLQHTGAKTIELRWDLGDSAVIEDRISEIEGKFGGVDILVNNTGGPPPTPAHGQSLEVWRKHFESMVLSVIAITDRVLPKMVQAKWGRIITSTSSGVVAPIPNLAVSNALRMSLVGWSKSLAREVARDGVTVNVILPGRIATDRIRFLDEQKAQREGRSVLQVAAESTASIPAGRYGEPQEYGDVVAFLASTRASYITGSILRVDGGLIASI
jgi:3-oxoacyl-[acyl-carrier protein] reductase